MKPPLQNRQAQTEVVPSVSALMLKALKEQSRQKEAKNH